MIEPLRFNKEIAFAHEINRPAFCNSCLSQKQSRMNPNIAIKYCSECPSSLGHQKDFGAFLCKACDDSIHDKGPTKFHLRQILVVGPGVRKRVLVRGDTSTFPSPLDKVKIKLRSRIYHGGKRIHKEPARYITFISGSCGKTLHVQVLGARNLVAGDIGGMSDPFVVYSFCGKTLGSTRVRPRSLNPRWDNETFIVPMEENLPPPRGVAPSQKDLFKLEVYDYDWFSSNEFLGHLEIPKSKLMKMAVVANQQPIRLPLTTKEYHGSASIRVGFNREHFFVRVLRAESLDKQDAILLSNPYAKIYLGFDNTFIGATSVMPNTTHPEWGDVSSAANEFRVRIEQLLLTEKRIRSNITINREGRENESSRSNNGFNELAEHLSILRIEVFSQRRFGNDILLGKCNVNCDDLRLMLPSLPDESAYDLEQFALQQRSLLFAASSVVTRAGVYQLSVDLLRGVGRTVRRWCWAPRNRFAHSHAKMKTEDEESSRKEDLDRNEDSADDDGTAFGPPPGADDSDIERASKPPTPKSFRPAPLTRGISAANVAGMARRALSTKNLLTSLSAPFAAGSSVPLVPTWSGIYPVNVMKDSAKAMAASAAAGLGLGMVNGQLILRLIPSSRGSVVVGLDDAVRQMSLGEKANVKCRYDYAYNNYCMGSNIPPRANIVFTVELLEINGRGRFGVPWRMFKRFLRALMRFFVWFTDLLKRWTSSSSPSATADASKKSHKKKSGKSGKSRKSGRFGGAVADSSSDSESGSSASDSSSDGEDGDGELLMGELGGDDQPVLSQDMANHRRVKADPRMRKHMTPSVKTGSQLMWGYKPPPPPAHVSTRRVVSSAKQQLRRDPSDRPLVDPQEAAGGEMEEEEEEENKEEDDQQEYGDEAEEGSVESEEGQQ